MNKKCQVFTPHNIVVMLLDIIEYEKNLYGKKIIENACGDGNILKVVVERYIKDCLAHNFSSKEIKIGLESDVFGIELDEGHHRNCIENLEQIANEYGICNVSWRILNSDFLKIDLDIEFDYVVGNPPYISYRDLDQEDRIFVKEHYSVCRKGKFDYCYAFIEKSIDCLRNRGKMIYLIPNSIFKNVFAQELRDYILPHLSQIFDYSTKKLFNVLTSSAIIMIDKGEDKSVVKYIDVANNHLFDIDKSNLHNKWVFPIKKVDLLVKGMKVRFADYFTSSITIATLYNKAYILKDYDEDENYIIIKDLKVEKCITRPTASPRNLAYRKKELIIFPYYYKDDLLMRYDEQSFAQYFPETVKYLKNFVEELSSRDSDKHIKWYEYGRTQALAHLNQVKLLTSTVVTKEVKIYELPKECIPYSGIYITSKSSLPLSFASEILQSDDFLEYVKGIGINASGMSLRITPRDINQYEFFI